MRKFLPLVAAAVIAAVPVVASSAVASAAPAPRHLVVKVTWTRHHRTEIVRVTSNPNHRRVQAFGVCRKPYEVFAGRVLHGAGVSRVHCAHGWDAAGYITGPFTQARYHRERGIKLW